MFDERSLEYHSGGGSGNDEEHWSGDSSSGGDGDGVQSEIVDVEIDLQRVALLPRLNCMSTSSVGGVIVCASPFDESSSDKSIISLGSPHPICIIFSMYR